MEEYILKLEFSEESEPYLLDISGLLYDLELAHDLSILRYEEDYKEFKYSPYFWYRNGRPIKDKHRIRAARIVKESPLLLEVVIPSLGAIWILMQIFEKVSNWELNREKLELEVRKLRAEERERKEKVIEDYSQQLQDLRDNEEANKIETRLVGRLSKNPIKLSSASLERHKQSNEDGNNDFSAH